jgi:hypothetical protein
LQNLFYANINRPEAAPRRSVIAGYRVFVHMCDKVMQLRKELRPQQGTAVCGNQRKSDVS